jgi:hypothetical protein
LELFVLSLGKNIKIVKEGESKEWGVGSEEQGEKSEEK